MKAAFALLAAFLAGCSVAPNKISATYIPPTTYQAYDCGQLRSEALRVVGKMSGIGARLEEASSNDEKLGWTAAILFWPAIFWMGGTRQQEAEYAVLKGEYDAVQQQMVQKRCAESNTAAMHGQAYAPPATTLILQPATTSTPQAVYVLPATVPQQPMFAPLPAVQDKGPKLGQDFGNAERLAKEQSCHPVPKAVLANRGPGYESYSVACANGDAWLIRCEYGNCRVLR